MDFCELELGQLVEHIETGILGVVIAWEPETQNVVVWQNALAGSYDCFASELMPSDIEISDAWDFEEQFNVQVLDTDYGDYYDEEEDY